MVSVHLNGQPTNLEKYMQSKKYNLIHIEDACHALGAHLKVQELENVNILM